jgi:FkbM family methyltransferase
MSSIIEIKLRGHQLKFDLSEDHYPPSYYESAAADEWEPHTVAFLERNLGVGKTFIDVGAATGITAIFAASLGSKVHAYEPNPKVFANLKKNVNLNNQLAHVVLNPIALSDSELVLSFNESSNREVLSPIVFTASEEFSESEVQVRSLADEVNKLQLPAPESVVMKMDVEGAEYRILRSPDCVATIAKKCGVLYFSLHPGFNLKLPSSRMFRVMTMPFRLLRVFSQQRQVFRCLASTGVVKQFGSKPVCSPAKFALVVLLGIHDWMFVPIHRS